MWKLLRKRSGFMKKYIIESETPLLDFTIEYPRIKINVNHATKLSRLDLLLYLKDEFKFYQWMKRTVTRIMKKHEKIHN